MFAESARTPVTGAYNNGNEVGGMGMTARVAETQWNIVGTELALSLYLLSPFPLSGASSLQELIIIIVIKSHS